MPARANYDYLINTKINRITILQEAPPKSGKRACLCRCDCGKEWEVSYGFILTGKTKSCGCLKDELSRDRIKHGMARRGQVTKEFKAWLGMINRVTYPSNKRYKDYGGRGITICDRWRNDFAAFFEDMGLAPSPKHTIDRDDVDGNYEPGNCRWATESEQARNKRVTRYYEFNGEKLTINGWSEKTGIPYHRLKKRLFYFNWPIEKALTT